MDVQQLKEIASQLACPSGEGAVSIVENMNNTNAFMTERSIEMLAPKSDERIVEIGPGNGEARESGRSTYMSHDFTVEATAVSSQR